ncbi:unnamed protein product, partial [Allacma fusca]
YGDHKDGKRKGSSRSPLLAVSKKSCPAPPKEKNAFIYMEGVPIDANFDISFADGTEIVYRCGFIKPKKNRWKMTCEEGTWVGTPIICDGDVPVENMTSVLKMINGSCTYTKDEEIVATFYNDQQLVKDTIDFPSGTNLVCLFPHQFHNTLH